jgi:hypothetical protein
MTKSVGQDDPSGAVEPTLDSLPFRCPQSRLRAVGKGTAWVFLRSMAAESVRKMIPRCLELAPQKLTLPGEHPVFFMLVHHQGVRPNILPIRGMDYLECLVAIPDLQWRSTNQAYRGPFCYMPRLFLNRWMAVFLGWLYAFPKLRERVDRTKTTFAVRRLLSGRPVISGSVEYLGTPASPTEFPAFGPIQSLLRQPFTQPLLGSFCLCSFLNFHFSDAQIQPLRGRLEFQEAFLPGLSVGAFDFETGTDAFEVAVPWDLPSPFLASQIQPANLTTT